MFFQNWNQVRTYEVARIRKLYEKLVEILFTYGYEKPYNFSLGIFAPFDDNWRYIPYNRGEGFCQDTSLKANYMLRGVQRKSVFLHRAFSRWESHDLIFEQHFELLI